MDSHKLSNELSSPFGAYLSLFVCLLFDCYLIVCCFVVIFCLK